MKLYNIMDGKKKNKNFFSLPQKRKESCVKGWKRKEKKMKLSNG